MGNNFNIEIIKPEEIIFSEEVKIVKIPSYEGDMSILKDHISVIAFLRPGIIKVEKSEGNSEEFFVEDGIVEFFKDKLAILSASVENVKNLSREVIENLNKDTQEKLAKQEITDQERYILNHKIDVLKEIRT